MPPGARTRSTWPGERRQRLVRDVLQDFHHGHRGERPGLQLGYVPAAELESLHLRGEGAGEADRPRVEVDAEGPEAAVEGGPTGEVVEQEAVAAADVEEVPAAVAGLEQSQGPAHVGGVVEAPPQVRAEAALIEVDEVVVGEPVTGRSGAGGGSGPWQLRWRPGAAGGPRAGAPPAAGRATRPRRSR